MSRSISLHLDRKTKVKQLDGCSFSRISSAKNGFEWSKEIIFIICVLIAQNEITIVKSLGLDASVSTVDKIRGNVYP